MEVGVDFSSLCLLYNIQHPAPCALECGFWLIKIVPCSIALSSGCWSKWNHKSWRSRYFNCPFGVRITYLDYRQNIAFFLEGLFIMELTHKPLSRSNVLVHPSGKSHGGQRGSRCRVGPCTSSGTQTMDWPLTYDEHDDTFGMSVKDIEYLDSDDSSSSDSPDSEGLSTSAVSALDAKNRVCRPRTLDLRREVLVYRTAAPTLPRDREHLKLRPTRSLEPTPSSGSSYRTDCAVRYKEEPSPGRCTTGAEFGAESTSSPSLVQATSGLQPPISPTPKQKLRAVRSLDTTLAHHHDNNGGQDSEYSPKSLGDCPTPSPTTKRRFPYLQKLAASMRVGHHHHHHHQSSGSTGSSPSPGNESPDGAGGFEDSPFSSNSLTSPKSTDSLTSPSSPSVMHRMKLPGSPSQKLNPRKLWRGKGHHQGKLQPSPVLATSFWSPMVSSKSLILFVWYLRCKCEA